VVLVADYLERFGARQDRELQLIAEEYTFVTRPVIVRGDRATAGFSATRVDELLG
jgi:arsenate reductase-like glutaredoxin family protein